MCIFHDYSKTSSVLAIVLGSIFLRNYRLRFYSSGLRKMINKLKNDVIHKVKCIVKYNNLKLS